MASDNVVDLDVLRPDARYVKLGGNKIDVSFIPCAITFELEVVVQEMAKLSQADLTNGAGEAARRGFDLAIDLCALFCKHDYPEMDRDWFMSHTEVGQIGAFAEAIKAALVRSYQGVERYQTNPPKAKAKK